MGKIMYRLVYRNGDIGAWGFDKEWAEYCAKKYNATIEMMVYMG